MFKVKYTEEGQKPRLITAGGRTLQLKNLKAAKNWCRNNYYGYRKGSFEIMHPNGDFEVFRGVAPAEKTVQGEPVRKTRRKDGPMKKYSAPNDPPSQCKTSRKSQSGGDDGIIGLRPSKTGGAVSI